MLTREQLTANINAMETQGASQEEIQGYLDNLPKPSSAPVDTPVSSKPQLSPDTVDIGNIWKGTKDVIKATPEIAGNIWDTFTTKQGLSDVWNVTKNAGVSSVENVIANYNDLFWGGAQKGLKAVGLDTMSEWSGNDKAISKAEAKKSSDEIKKFFYGEGDVKGFSDPTDTRGFLEKLQAPDGEKEVAKIVGSQVPTFLALMGITVLAKGTNIPAIPATLSASFAMNTGDAYQQGKDYVESTGQPMTPELDAQIQKASLLSGAMTAPLDAFGMDRILKPSQFINFKSKLAGSIVNGILDTGVDTVAEGGTEALQEVFQNAWAKTYNANQDLFSGVGEAFFGGGLFGGGSSALINSSGMLRTGIVERLKQGEDVATIKADVIKGAKEAGSPITEAKIDEAITDAQKVYDGVVTDITDKLDSGKSVQEVALDVSQHTDVDNAVAFVSKIDESRQTSTVQDTQKELFTLSDKVDASVLKKTASDLQNDFERVQSHIDEQVKSIKDEVDALKEKVNNAPDKSTEKKRLKIELENKRGELRDAEASFYDKVTNNSVQFRSFVTDYAMQNGATKEQATQIANTTADIVTSDNAGERTVEDIVAEQLNIAPKSEIKPVSTKKRQKVAKTDEKVSKVEDEKKAPAVESKVKVGDNVAFHKYTKGKKDGVEDKQWTVKSILNMKSEGVKVQLVNDKGTEIWTTPDGVEIVAKTQKEKVKEVVEKKGKATIKEIADETGILEPNVRRILGMGAKEGEFKRVDSGVYTITTKDGTEVAVVIPADAVETLPKLASEGFKSDMVFLDIPYDTPAVKGGNRGVDYNLISVEDFAKVLDALTVIMKEKTSPVIHMFSQAESGMAKMQKYNDLFLEKGFIPVGRGEYQKTYKDGSPVAFPTVHGSMVTKPEGIIVFTQSGEVKKDLGNLNFKLVRPKGYATEKHADMLKSLIEMTTEEGDVILDPFAGSGVTGAEAVKAGRKAVLIEKDAEVAKTITKPRVEGALAEVQDKLVKNVTSRIDKIIAGIEGDTFTADRLSKLKELVPEMDVQSLLVNLSDIQSTIEGDNFTRENIGSLIKEITDKGKKVKALSDKRAKAEERLAKIEGEVSKEDPMSKAFHLGKGGFAKNNNVSKAIAENERNITKTIKQAKEHVKADKELKDIAIVEKNYEKLSNQYKEALTLQHNKKTSKGVDLSEGELRELKKMIREYEVRMGRLERSHGFVRPEVTFATDTNVASKEADPIKRNTAIVVKLQEGTATLEEYNAGYKDFIDNKEAIKAQLLTQKKDELMKRIGRFSYSIRPSSSKNDMVSSILDTMESRFALGKNIVYSFGGRGSSGAVSDLVEKMTQEDLTKYAEKVKENTKAYAESIQAHKKALTNPETLDEFKTYLQANNGDTTKLTPEQLKNYDELLALAGKAKREKAIEDKGNVRGVNAGTELTVTETKNTKTGEDIFVVKLSDRVEKETYQALNTSSKKLGGYYSRFSKGFLFKDRASADQFVQVGNGKEVKTDAPVIRAENKKNATAQKLADMAISMREKANEELNRERLTNTSRRAGMASGAEESARVDLAMADTMENLSKAIESREAVLLDGITARTQIEALESILRRAHYENSRKIEGYGKQEEFRKQAPTEEDIPFVSKFPDPVGMVGLKEAVQKGLKTSGSIKLAKTVQKAIEKLPADTNVFPASFKGMETIAELVDNLNLDSYSSLRHEVATFKRLKAMGVTGTAELRAILREFLTYRGTKQEANKAVELERKLIGAKVGIDFFPTPTPVAERMVSDAGVEAGMKVLEPSAGNGNIAEVMRDKGANVDVLEISGELRNVLEAKGFNIVGNNFMDYTEGGYDAIVMNPPFSNNQDIEHIQHAYTLLKEGGTLTAIAGEGAFFRGTSIAQGFQSWLEEVNADVEKLEENTFMDKKLMVNTGANARLIAIKKKASNDVTSEFTKEELAKAREQAKETVSFYLGSAEAGYRIFVPESNSMDLKVVGVPSSFPQHLPDNMRSRKTFDRLMPFWEKQERPSAKTPMLQELYDIFQKDVEEDTLKYAKMNKENEEKAKNNPTDNIPFKTKAEDTLAIDFKQRKYKFNVEYGVKEAKAYIEDVQNRLGISFDVEWVDEVVSRYSLDYFTRVKTPIEYAEGLMEDNTIAIKKNMDAYTAEHEIGHLTLANIDRISAFKDKGITRDNLMRAMANKEGVVWTEKNDLKLEEQIMYDFEKYAHDRTYGKEPAPQKGIIQQFFDTLYNIISKFVKANVESKEDILKDYYDVLYEGYTTSNEITYLENNGIVKSFIEDGVLDAENIGRHKGEDIAKFKLSEETDAYFQKKKKEFNDLIDKKNKLVEIVDTRKSEIEGAINAKKEIAQIVQEADPKIKEASRFTTKKKPPVGTLTKRGEEFVDSLEFVNRAEAEAEIKEYLLAKTKLVETTNQLRKISKDIAIAKKEGKATREALRDVARRLKLRKRLLEQKDFYMSLGKGQGKKEAFSIIQKRGRIIKGTQEMFGISDAKAKELIGSKRINQMSEKQFNEFLTWFTNNAQLQSAMQDARDEVTAILFEKQFQKEDNLRKSLGLPPLKDMTEAQATMYAGILYTYQFGDVFLTKREMETSARTKYEEIKTERELIDKIEEVAGIPRGELKSIDATSSDRYKNWFQLSKKNLFYDWLVGRNMIAKTKEIQQVYMFRRELDTLTRNARKSRSGERSLKENIWEFVAPTDAEVFEALNTGDFSKLTTEEKLLADFLTMMFRTKYNNLTKNFKDFKGRENYVTHMSRDFFETLKDTGSLKEAFDIFRKEQKDTENAVEILAGQTGEILAFDKFLPYMLKRSDKIIPSKNVSRIALTYFTATTRKELLDEFIPEAMLTLHGYKVLNGQTAKGLDLKPFLETFTKEYLNNAKGRRIDYITRQGSDWDTGLMAFTSWISFKYIGGNPILAFMNLFGDLVALSAGTTNAQKVQSIVRSFKSNNVDEAIRGLIGHNPLVDLLNTQTGLFQRILPVWFSMMSSTSYLANKFTVKGLLTEEEFKTGIISDERIQEMARQINKFKLTDSYGRSLVGSTTAGKASLQFKTWAVPFLITGVEHIKSFATVLKEKGFNPETKKDAIELARIVIIGGLMYVAVQAISNAFGGDDDKDNYLWKQIENNLNTIYGILSMPFDKANLAPVIIGEIGAMQDLLLQLATQEAYAKPTGKGQYAGDLKALQTLKKIIIPAGATRVFNIKPDERTPSQVLIDESLKTGEFDAESIAMMTSMNWGEKTPEQRENIINEIERTHTVLEKYPNSKVASIILGEKNNKDRVAKLIQYSEKVGVDATYEEMKTLMKDKDLYANKKKYTGAFISAELFRDFQLARKKLQTNK